MPVEPIAIVGAGAIFPGALDLAGFWQNVLEKKDLVTEIPPGHWRIDDYYDPDPKAQDKTYAKRGAFLPDVPFDSMGFGVPPSIVPATDTSQLIALIVAKSVLDDVGHDVDLSKVSVILGVTGAQELLGSLVSRLQRPVWERSLRAAGLDEAQVEDACKRIASHYVDWQESSFPGLLGNVVAGRIANRLGTGGTNCIVDAACASALSAVHLAMLELWAGTSDMVVTGGVDTMNDIFMYMCFSKTPALSPTGDCRPFSENADGTLLGEGIGMVALKRLSDAERDGDHIYAIIKGLGTSSDGRAKSVYAPVPEGQAEALRRAYKQAGYAPETVELMEAHGTATKAGDAAELKGLQLVFRPGEETQTCALGSVKSQIGHTKAAAGIAGLLKVALALHHKVLPPTIKVDKPAKSVDWANSAFYVNTEARPWVRDGKHPRRGSVSSFGFGGSNFHVALEEYLGDAPRPARLDPWSAELVAFSADTRDTLLAQIDAAYGQDVRELALKTQAGFDTKAPWRLTLLVTGDLEAKLKKAADVVRVGNPHARGDIFFSPEAVQGSVAFLFPGQGSQAVNMGASLAMRFSDVLGAFDHFEDEVPGLARVVFPIPAFSDDERAEQKALLTRTEWAQPALGALEVGLVALLGRFGIEPAMAGGHSFGELSALAAAGAIDTATLARAARERGELMAAASSTPGAMAAVFGGIDAVRPHLGEGVIIANHNAPEQVVIAGAVPAVEAAMTALGAAGLKTQRLDVATAFHSPLVASAAGEFSAWLRARSFGMPSIPVWSNTTAHPHADDLATALGTHLANPVRWVEQIEAMYEAGARVFVEVGPGTALAGMVGRILDGRPHAVVSLDAKSRDGFDAFLAALARLAALGLPVNLAELGAGRVLKRHVTPKGALMINGANYGKPYPRPDSKPVPPNPPRVIEALPTAPEPRRLPPVAEPAPIPSPPPVAQVTPPAPLPAPSGVAEMSTTRPPDPAASGWISAFLDSQRQLADVQESFQRTMADAHIAFLRSQEEATRAMLGMMGAPAPAPTAWPAPQPVVAAPAYTPPPAPAYVPPVATPVYTPLPTSQPAWSAPEPVAAAPAPVVVAPPPVAAAPALDLPALLLAVVAEKTGYPASMLQMGMSLEADLGIDSIKRVEILSAVREKAPQLPEPDAETLGRLQTLGQIVDVLGAALPAAAPATVAAAAAAAPAGLDLPALLLEVVAEKTGYPASMLQMGMSLEADLGIDSIKRVEILSAVREKAPQLPEPDAETLGRLQTLGQIVDVLGAALPAAAPATVAAAVAAAPAGLDLPALLLEVVAEKTGYPASMLQMGMSLEADLGIDSIKRVEILSAVREKAPQLPEPDAETLGRLQTLGQIVDVLGAALPAATPAEKHDNSDHIAVLSGPEPHPVGIHRYEIALVPAPLGEPVDLGPVTVLGDDTLCAALKQLGVDAVTGEPTADRGLVIVGGHPFDAFKAAKVARLSTVVVVTRLGGDFGRRGTGDVLEAGLHGLAKTIAVETPDAFVRVLDVDPTLPVEAIAATLRRAGPVEIGLTVEGTYTPRLAATPWPMGTPALGAEDVVVVSGGARGVTAACVLALAASTCCSFVLLGRSRIDEPEAPEVAAATDEGALKRVLAPKASSPAALGKQVAGILAAREARATLAALTALGSDARYYPVDVQDKAALAAALDNARKELGPITGLVHGAGVLADKRLKDKTEAQFKLVWDTKIGGIDALLDATRGDTLKVMGLFSSVAARTGNFGQCDYAAANEVLNRIAAREAARRPGCVCRSIGWGPWAGGMVTAALAKSFEARGVPLLPIDLGARAFVGELASAGPIETVIGGQLPTGDDTAVIRRVHARDYPFLRDHTVADTPVFPVVLALEWFGQLARELKPGKHVAAIRNLRVMKGITLSQFDTSGDLFEVTASGSDPVVLEIRSPGGPLHYRAEVELRDTAPTPPAAPGKQALAASPFTQGEIYERYLFHGPDFQAIQRLVGVGETAAEAELHGTRELGWPTNGWLTDMAAFDGGLQLAVLWARTRFNAASLPTGIAAWRNYGAPSAGPVRSVFSARSSSKTRAIGDLSFVDAAGRVFAEFEGVEVHALPGGEYPKNTAQA